MKGKREIASFVLRFTQEFWQDAQGEPRVEWRGHICHVQDGNEMRFTELTEALNFIQRSLFLATLRCVPQEDKIVQDKALSESFKLWEKFAAGYTELMAEAIQQAMKQSEVFQKQVSEAVEQVIKPWRPLRLSTPMTEPDHEITLSPEQEQMEQTLFALQAQISLLTTKVNKLEEALGQQQPVEQA